MHVSARQLQASTLCCAAPCVATPAMGLAVASAPRANAQTQARWSSIAQTENPSSKQMAAHLQRQHRLAQLGHGVRVGVQVAQHLGERGSTTWRRRVRGCRQSAGSLPYVGMGPHRHTQPPLATRPQTSF